MPNFKHIERGLKFVPVDFTEQVMPGTFEHALCHLIDNEVDLSPLRARFNNDRGGASAYDPAILLKIVLLGYRGMVSSRQMERACRDVVLFMAVAGDNQPHFTTIAHFVATLGNTVATMFTEVLLVCERQGLIGKGTVRHRWCETAVERIEGEEWHAEGLPAPGEEDGEGRGRRWSPPTANVTARPIRTRRRAKPPGSKP